ncbi:MAG: alanine--glyoxylate aminotransferase family protein [Chromatiales bacterium]|jgi:aspartate aminotransferase-like enzyme|nr:alanine--glyoxylate aminotransferase family protein [Chromatiales bacterium]
MPGLRPDVDPDGLLEYSVVFTDRALNHMSASFQTVMRDISGRLKQVYGADGVAIVPGGGTYAMEAVARQFANGSKTLIIRNGFFSFRWSQILDAGSIAASSTVMKATRQGGGERAPFAPATVDQVVERIRQERPGVVFAPHVETASGLLLPDDYIRDVTAAVHEVDGLFVLDCIASGAMWLDMRALGVDVLLSAPQKGWSSSPCAGLVMLNDSALQRLESTTSSSFACDLKRWYGIMQAYENGGHAYHATMPTDALTAFRDAMVETEVFGLARARQAQIDLGQRVRAELESRQFQSVAASGFQAPGVVVSFTDDPDAQTGKVFAERGLQVAAGVPLQCDEGESFRSFRLGLFGLDKLGDVDRTVANLTAALDSL